MVHRFVHKFLHRPGARCHCEPCHLVHPPVRSLEAQVDHVDRTVPISFSVGTRWEWERDTLDIKFWGAAHASPLSSLLKFNTSIVLGAYKASHLYLWCPQYIHLNCISTLIFPGRVSFSSNVDTSQEYPNINLLDYKHCIVEQWVTCLCCVQRIEDRFADDDTLQSVLDQAATFRDI